LLHSLEAHHVNFVVVCSQVVNHHLLRDLTKHGLWNEEIKNQIAAGKQEKNYAGYNSGLNNKKPLAVEMPRGKSRQQ
jgi:hypothetical protein